MASAIPFFIIKTVRLPRDVPEEILMLYISEQECMSGEAGLWPNHFLIKSNEYGPGV